MHEIMLNLNKVVTHGITGRLEMAKNKWVTGVIIYH